MTVTLELPTIRHKQAAMAYRQEHFDHGEPLIHGDGGLDTADSYEQWLAQTYADHSIEPSEERVPAHTYFGVVNREIVGTIQVRHTLNANLMSYAGHIGYGVRPTRRRLGYGTQMLALALDKCRDLGISRVLVTCDSDNIASASTIKKNGGVFENAIAEPDGNIIHRYWIALQ